MRYDYDAVFVCREKLSLSPPELTALGAKQDACWALPAVGRLWPSDVDGGDVDDDESQDHSCINVTK